MHEFDDGILLAAVIIHQIDHFEVCQNKGTENNYKIECNFIMTIFDSEQKIKHILAYDQCVSNHSNLCLTSVQQCSKVLVARD